MLIPNQNNDSKIGAHLVFALCPKGTLGIPFGVQTSKELKNRLFDSFSHFLNPPHQAKNHFEIFYYHLKLIKIKIQIPFGLSLPLSSPIIITIKEWPNKGTPTAGREGDLDLGEQWHPYFFLINIYINTNFSNYVL